MSKDLAREWSTPRPASIPIHSVRTPVFSAQHRARLQTSRPASVSEVEEGRFVSLTPFDATLIDGGEDKIMVFIRTKFVIFKVFSSYFCQFLFM